MSIKHGCAPKRRHDYTQCELNRYVCKASNAGKVNTKAHKIFCGHTDLTSISLQSRQIQFKINLK